MLSCSLSQAGVHSRAFFSMSSYPMGLDPREWTACLHICSGDGGNAVISGSGCGWTSCLLRLEWLTGLPLPSLAMKQMSTCSSPLGVRRKRTDLFTSFFLLDRILMGTPAMTSGGGGGGGTGIASPVSSSSTGEEVSVVPPPPPLRSSSLVELIDSYCSGSLCGSGRAVTSCEQTLDMTLSNFILRMVLCPVSGSSTVSAVRRIPPSPLFLLCLDPLGIRSLSFWTSSRKSGLLVPLPPSPEVCLDLSLLSMASPTDSCEEVLRTEILGRGGGAVILTFLVLGLMLHISSNLDDLDLDCLTLTAAWCSSSVSFCVRLPSSSWASSLLCFLSSSISLSLSRLCCRISLSVLNPVVLRYLAAPPLALVSFEDL